MKKIFIFIGIFVFSFFFLIGASNTSCNDTSTCNMGSWVDCSDCICAKNNCFFNCSDVVSCFDCAACQKCNDCSNKCGDNSKVIENVTGKYQIIKEETNYGENNIMVTVRLSLDFPKGIDYQHVYIDGKLIGAGETRTCTENIDHIKGGQTYSVSPIFYYSGDITTLSFTFEYVVRGVEA